MKDGLSVISRMGTVKGRLDKPIGHIVLYLVFKDYTKYPIKWQDIIQKILKAHGRMCYEWSYMHVERSKLYEM